MAELVITGGPLAGRRLTLTGELVVGRADAHVIVEDPAVSRRHAVVRLEGDRVTVEDLGSTNGTWVNGRRIEGPTHLGPGDVLQIGESIMHVGATLAPPPAPVPFPGTGPAPGLPIGAGAMPPASPFTGVSAAARSRPARRGPASRRALAGVLAVAVIVATGVALILYFLPRLT